MNGLGNKKNIYIISIVIFLLVAVSMAIESKADMEPDYNIAVRIDPAIIVHLNEKIEVYCEKDDQFFMIIDLNKNNYYEYKKMFVNGMYTFQARVRYDMNEEYTILPDSQVIELTYKNNNILNEIVFTIEGVRVEPELHSHLADSESDPESKGDLNQEEKIYTMDDIDELYLLQESLIAEAEAAFAEQEVWEQNHNFVSKHGVSGQTVSAVDDDTLPMHVYPEVNDESTVEHEYFLESEVLIVAAEETTESEEETGIHIEKSGYVITIVGIVLLLFLVICLGLYLRKWRNQHE